MRMELACDAWSVQPCRETEAARLIEEYLANLATTFNGGDGRLRACDLEDGRSVGGGHRSEHLLTEDATILDRLLVEHQAQLAPRAAVGVGHRENLTLQQLQVNLEMESHEEKLALMIRQSKEREAQQEAERRREAHEVAATHQLEFAALRRTVLESQSKTIDELRSGVGHIVSKLDAAMQLSFELEQKGVPSRMQLLPHDIESGGSVRERFAAPGMFIVIVHMGTSHN